MSLEKLNLKPKTFKNQKRKDLFLRANDESLKNFPVFKRNNKQKLENKEEVKQKAPKQCFVYFKRSKRNIIISVCDSQNRVKAVLSIGHLKVNKIKLKVRARKAIYNLKKLSYMLGSIVYKGGFTHLYLKFKNDFPKKVGNVFLNTLKSNKKFKINNMVHYVSKPHNGCRKPKIRRK